MTLTRMLDLAIRGGTVITAEQEVQYDVGIDDERIAQLDDVGEAKREIDARRMLVLPGVVDVHTHMSGRRTPDRGGTADDFESGTIAAACGGITTIVDYARQYAGQTLQRAIDEAHERAQALAAIDYSFHPIVSDFSEASLARIGDLVAAGFPTVKAFMMLVNDADLLRLMRAAAEAHALVMLHAESGPVLEFQKQMLFARGRQSTDWYVDSRPEIGEAEATSRAVDYAAVSGADVCVVHLS